MEFSVEECPKAPTSGRPLFTFEQFHTLRNETLAILSRYGTVGPNGKLCIRDSAEQSTEVWSGDGIMHDRHSDFYVVSDIWNRWLSRILSNETGFTVVSAKDSPLDGARTSAFKHGDRTVRKFSATPTLGVLSSWRANTWGLEWTRLGFRHSSRPRGIAWRGMILPQRSTRFLDDCWRNIPIA